MSANLDPVDAFHSRVLVAMDQEELGWLTTTDSRGVPQPNPVWFVWHDDAITIYSIPGQAKLTNIGRNPLVSFNLQTGGGLPVFVATGPAELLEPADRTAGLHTAYWAKYGDLSLKHLQMNQEQFEAEYSATIRIRPSKIRGF
jgi:PPOX class probable F420-dependent enzyme